MKVPRLTVRLDSDECSQGLLLDWVLMEVPRAYC